MNSKSSLRAGGLNGFMQKEMRLLKNPRLAVCALSAMTLLGQLPGAALAQSKESGSFFEQNYAEGPFKGDSKDSMERSARPVQEPTAKANEAGAQKAEDMNGRVDDSGFVSEPEPEPEIKLPEKDFFEGAASGDGVQLKSFGALLSGADEGFLVESIERWRDVLLRYPKIKPGPVIIVGKWSLAEKVMPLLVPAATIPLAGARTDIPQELAKSPDATEEESREKAEQLLAPLLPGNTQLAELQKWRDLPSAIHFAQKKPEAFINVSRSPTWVLETDTGNILMEGFKNPAVFLNKDGKFVTPLGADPEESASVPSK